LRPQPQGAGGGGAAPAAAAGGSSAALQAVAGAWGGLARARAAMAAALNARARIAVHVGAASQPAMAPRGRAGDGSKASTMGACAAGVAEGAPCAGAPTYMQGTARAACVPCTGVHGNAHASVLGLVGTDGHEGRILGRWCPALSSEPLRCGRPTPAHRLLMTSLTPQRAVPSASRLPSSSHSCVQTATRHAWHVRSVGVSRQCVQDKLPVAFAACRCGYPKTSSRPGAQHWNTACSRVSGESCAKKHFELAMRLRGCHKPISSSWKCMVPIIREDACKRASKSGTSAGAWTRMSSLPATIAFSIQLMVLRVRLSLLASTHLAAWVWRTVICSEASACFASVTQETRRLPLLRADQSS